jgi:Nif-specific regulatory protein
VFTIFVPPLRDRKADMLLLADHFVEKFSREHGKIIKRISTPAIDMLMAYHWPGNVRELENVIERALTLCDGGTIQPDDIELRGPPTFEDSVPPHRPGTLPQTLEDMERASIRKALEEARYNKTAAARSLGISFRALRYRIKKLGIE